MSSATGYRPAVGAYDALWTRDHAYTVWHDPVLQSSAVSAVRSKMYRLGRSW